MIARGRPRVESARVAPRDRYDRRAELTTDRIAVARAAYEEEGPGRINRRYGYVTRPIA